MKIEILFPEVANLYGDIFNMKYLQQCVPEAEFVEASLESEPTFSIEQVEMLYMGPMTERSQELVIAKLVPYKEKLIEMIESNVIFLITGNAIEIFGQFIEKEDGSKIEALGIIDTYAKRDMFHRYNSLILGKMLDMKIVGFKNQFSHSFGDHGTNYLFEVLRGDGLNPQSKYEGFRKNNFMATYTLGPILIMNPDFARYVMNLLGVQKRELAFEEQARKAYKIRLVEFENKRVDLS
ncbi:MAG TPA: hypothetical protein VJZ04_02015 [Lachnospiraceae bacterium]|nr:hypothetical protein [Lachnospiraceae bacterium]